MGIFVRSLFKLKKNPALPHLFRLTLGTQFCDNLVSQVSGEARLYSAGHWETASSWFLEYESLSDTQVIRKLKQKQTNKEKVVERPGTRTTEKKVCRNTATATKLCSSISP